MSIVMVGIDPAKHVFAAHRVDNKGESVLVNPKVAQDQLPAMIAQLPPCTIGMGACSSRNAQKRKERRKGARLTHQVTAGPVAALL